MTTLSGSAASAAAREIGWHYILGALRTSVATRSIADAAEVLAIAAQATESSSHLRAHAVADRVELTVQPPTGQLTDDDARMARAIAAALTDADRLPSSASGRATQLLEIAIDAIDIPRIRPFWQAVLDYVPNPASAEELIDPLREGPTVWFQQMDEPREQRNRIHFDITVPHKVADARIAAALNAGGVLVSDARARAFWILADAEGNEICVCTWEDRD